MTRCYAIYLLILSFLNCCTDKLILSPPPVPRGRGGETEARVGQVDRSKAKEWVCETRTSVIRAPHEESTPLLHTACCWIQTKIWSRTSRGIVCWKVPTVSCVTHIILMHNVEGSDNDVLSQEKSPWHLLELCLKRRLREEHGTGFSSVYDLYWRNECNTVGAELDPSAACKCH